MRVLLSKVAVRSRTGEVGIIHGANRFVSTHLCLSKAERALLGSVAVKLGLQKGVAEIA
jgi:hypothetical protein